MTKRARTTFGALFSAAEAQDRYWAAKAALDFTEAISVILAARHINRAELAKRLGTSKAYVTKLLRGDVNFTLQTMVRLARVLGAEFRPSLFVQHARTLADVETATRQESAALMDIAAMEPKTIRTESVETVAGHLPGITNPHWASLTIPSGYLH